jgi:hypothetical protein
MTFKKSQLLAIVMAFVLVAAMVIFAVFKNNSFSGKNEMPFKQKSTVSQEITSSPETEEEYYINKDGHKWQLNEEDTDFRVTSSKDSKIKFWEGNITPLKVHPGDTQSMRIVVSGINGIKSVIAEIETDNGTTTVELKKTGTVSFRDLDPRFSEVMVNDRNELVMLKQEEAEARRLALISSEEANSSSSIKIARASENNSEKEVFEGSWLVKDTSVRDYITIFRAEDNDGNKDSLTLAWSDPCQVVFGGSDWALKGDVEVSYSCPINQPYGVEEGNITLNGGADILIGPSGKLVFNPEYGINMRGGKIAFSGTGGSFGKGYLWALDADNDGYTGAETRQVTSDTTSPGTGWKRQASLTSAANDCYDSNANAKPGQTLSFSVHRGDNSFDYNCDGTATLMGWSNYYNTSTSVVYDQLCAAHASYPDGQPTFQYTYDAKTGYTYTPFSPQASSGFSWLGTALNCGGYLGASEDRNWLNSSLDPGPESTFPCNTSYYQYIYNGTIGMFCR